MKFGRSAPTIIIAASLLVVTVVCGVATLLTSRLVNAAHEDSYTLMRQVLASVLKSTEEKALVRAELVESMPAVRSAFISRDRAKLHAECKQMFEEQSEKYGLDKATFHVPGGVVFLRLSKPAAFGDDQSAYRPMLADVHRNKVVRKGIAIGRSGATVSGIVPILDEAGTFQGSFEMGLELESIFNKIKEAYGIEAGIYLDEKLLREIATDLGGDILSPKNRVGRYIRFHATNPELAKALVGDGDVEVTEPKHYERTVVGTPWGVQLVPVYNYTNKQIGVVALASDFGADKAAARRSAVWLFLTTCFGAVFLCGVILVVIRARLTAPLAAMNERFATLADGDDSKPADPLDACCEELRTLSASYERLRTGRPR